MTILTAEQVAGTVSAGGGPPSGTTVAQWVALARRESGFNDSVQDFLMSGHWGLWQISEDHFERYGSQYGTKENFVAALKSPLVNWNVAARLYDDSGWSPWRASGGPPIPSRADNDAAANADTAFGASGGGDLGGAVPQGVGPALEALDPIGSIADVLKSVLDPILAAAKWIGDPHNWTRVIEVVGGIALGIVAANIVLKPVVDESIVPAIAKGFR